MRVAAGKGVVDVERIGVRLAIGAAERPFHSVRHVPVELAPDAPVRQALVTEGFRIGVTKDDAAVHAQRDGTEIVAVVDRRFPHVRLTIRRMRSAVEERNDVLALGRRERRGDLHAEQARRVVGNFRIVQRRFNRAVQRKDVWKCLPGRRVAEERRVGIVDRDFSVHGRSGDRQDIGRAVRHADIDAANASLCRAIDFLHEVAAVIVARKLVVINFKAALEREREPAVIVALKTRIDRRGAGCARFVETGRAGLVGRKHAAIGLAADRVGEITQIARQGRKAPIVPAGCARRQRRE